MKTERTVLVLAGWVLGYFGGQFAPYPGNMLLLIVGVAFSVLGCYRWAKIKSRHWAFMFWGILSPIGLLGVSLLKDKTIQNEVKEAV